MRMYISLVCIALSVPGAWAAAPTIESDGENLVLKAQEVTLEIGSVRTQIVFFFSIFLYSTTSLCVIKIGTEVVTLLIIYQIRSCLGGSEGNVGAFEEHKQ